MKSFSLKVVLPEQNHPKSENRKGMLNLTRIGDPPVLSGNLPDSICDLEESVGKLPTETGKLPVLPEARI
jgi:hypothetical protein